METLSGIKHPAFQQALALAKPAGRAATGQYLIEGSDLVAQALRSPSVVRGVFALESEIKAFRDLCVERNIPLYLTSSGLIAKLVGTGYETAVTALAVVEQRLLTEDELIAPDALLLVGERIQDPRNVGVLIRTAEAAGCRALLLSSDSAEPFSRAATRSTTGSILRLPLCLAPNLPQTLERLKECGMRVVASSGQATRLAYDAPLHERPLAMVVGNEGVGLMEETRAVAHETVALPMAPNGADSLNVTVAAGAALYEAIRQRLVAQREQAKREQIAS